MNKLEQFSKVAEYVFLTDKYGFVKKVVFPIATIVSVDLGCRLITGNSTYSYLGVDFPAHIESEIRDYELMTFGLSLIYMGANTIRNCLDLQSRIK